MRFYRVNLFLAFLVSAAFPAAKASLGNASVLASRITAEGIAASNVFTLAIDASETLTFDLDAIEADQAGFTMSGRARGSAGSDFILKGDASEISGWVVLRDRDAGYEYSTDGQGVVWAEKVPISRIFPVCDLPDGPAESGAIFPEPPIALGPPDSLGSLPGFIKPYPGTSIRKLQSRPGATQVIYVDVTRIMNGETPIGWTKDQMYQIWQGFTAGLSMFDVNITTDSAIYKAAGLKNSGKAIMYDQTGTSFSPVNGFGSSRFSTIYRKSSPQYNAGTLIHEVGHLLGLSHDGGPNQEYFPGFKTYGWCPIMGSHVSALSYTNTLWQWSKGQYAQATQTQDDIALIGRHLPFREDDITAPTSLALDGDSVSLARNWGQISSSDDSDTFTFQIGATAGGRVRLNIDRIEYSRGSMLDVDATLRDASGRVVTRKNKIAARSADIDTTLPAGKYSLTLKGGAEGTPSNGFSNYSSLGYYGIQGRIIGASIPVAIAARHGEANAGLTATAHGANLELRFQGVTRVGDIALYAARGERVFASKERVSSIDTSRLPPGLYLLAARVDGRSVSRRIALP